jgi:hypothetical protein
VSSFLPRAALQHIHKIRAGWRGALATTEEPSLDLSPEWRRGTDEAKMGKRADSPKSVSMVQAREAVGGGRGSRMGIRHG